MDSLRRLRRSLHRNPELPGSEEQTAERIIEFFDALDPDSVIRNLGGHGAAFVFSGSLPGPTVLLRCELDAVPIDEIGDSEYRSATRGVSHACGHDGHMAILAGVGADLSARRPKKGRVVLLYQPAEENGAGAAAVIRDPHFAQVRPDYVFALHNLPGYSLGEIILRTGTFNCASQGMTIELSGATAHAAQPETGVAPTRAMCRIIDELRDLDSKFELPEAVAFATVVGASLGEKAFGTAPGFARIWATLRSETDGTMNRMFSHMEKRVGEIASRENLGHTITAEDVFLTTQNSEDAVEIIRQAADDLPIRDIDRPFPWSEDFGRFTSIASGALFGIGAGENGPELHNPDYGFVEELLPLGVDVFGRIVCRILG